MEKKSPFFEKTQSLKKPREKPGFFQLFWVFWVFSKNCDFCQPCLDHVRTLWGVFLGHLPRWFYLGISFSELLLFCWSSIMRGILTKFFANLFMDLFAGLLADIPADLLQIFFFSGSFTDLIPIF